MDRVQVIQHKGKEIVFLDFTRIDRKNRNILRGIIDEAKNIIKAKPHGSVLTLVDVTGLVFNIEVVESFKDFTAHNKPYVKAGAVVGITGLQEIAYKAVMKFSGRHLPIFHSLEQAKDWLAIQ
ncbi:MAG: hypothetical protein ACM3WV_07095 [Bacillota bacterium]